MPTLPSFVMSATGSADPQFAMIAASGITRTLHFGQSLDCFGQGFPNFWLRIAAKRLIQWVSRRRRRPFGMTPAPRCL